MMSVKGFLDYQENENKGKRLENGEIQRNGSVKNSLELGKMSGCTRGELRLPTMR